MSKATKTTIYLTERQLARLKRKAMTEGFHGNVSLYLRTIGLSYEAVKDGYTQALIKGRAP